MNFIKDFLYTIIISPPFIIMSVFILLVFIMFILTKNITLEDSYVQKHCTVHTLEFQGEKHQYILYSKNSLTHLPNCIYCKKVDKK